MHDTGCLGLVHWDDPEGWNGEGGGICQNEYSYVKFKNKIKLKKKSPPPFTGVMETLAF